MAKSTALTTAPPLDDSPPWLASLESSMVARMADGTTILRRPPTPDQHRWLLDEERRLMSALNSTSTSKEMAVQLARLDASFGVPNQPDTLNDLATRNMMMVLHRYPAWAIERAVNAWMSREHSEGNENYAFRPTPPQLARLCRIVMEPTRDRYGRIRALAHAEAPQMEPSPEERARVDAMLRDYLVPRTMPGSRD